jgi:hypothetical protein
MLGFEMALREQGSPLERRGERRFQLQLDCRVAPLDRPGEPLVGVTLDMSRSGVRVLFPGG